jgi:hypothetical protein
MSERGDHKARELLKMLEEEEEEEE